MSRGKVFLLESQQGRVHKVQSPLLLQAVANAAGFHEVMKAASGAETSAVIVDKNGTLVDGVKVHSRPFDFHLYAFALTANTYHARAVRAKVKDVVGRKWEIGGPAADDLPSAGEKIRAAEFLDRAFRGQTFSEGLSLIWTDYEALGNGYLEVIPNTKGEPVELRHLPATDVYERLDGLGFVQSRAGAFAHFRLFGADDAIKAIPETDPLGRAKTAVLPFRRYMSFSPVYGIPSIMPAFPSVALMTLIREYQLQFFQNNAVPDYAVLLEGDWEEGAEEKIQQYFRMHLKGQAHKTMVFQLPEGGKIVFEKLSEGTKEGSYQNLWINCRDEIVHAHGIPPQKVGIVETGKLGGNLSTEQKEEYKQTTVEPGQAKAAAAITRLLRDGLKLPKATLQFEPYDTDDREANAKVDQIYLNARVLVPNEVRARRFPGLDPLPGGDEPAGAPTVGDMAGVDQLIGQVQESIASVLAGGGK